MKPRILELNPIYMSLGAAIVAFAGWFVVGGIAERRQMRALGYAGPPSQFHADFVAQRIKPGTPPREVYRVLSPGAHVSYYLQTAGIGDSVIVQYFDYSLLGTGPYVAVLYRGSGPGNSPTVFDVYTDSFGVSDAQRISDDEAYAALHWRPDAPRRSDRVAGAR